MNKLIFILGLCAASVWSMAQPRLELQPDTLSMGMKKLQWGVDVGTSFTSNFKNLNGSSVYVAPHLTYPVSDKFKVSGGFALNHTTYWGTFRNFENPSISQSSLDVNSIFAYVSGSYLVSKKITISGSAFYGKEFFANAPGNNSAFNFDTKGISMDVRYNISENAAVGIGVSFVDGYRPYYSDPFYQYRPTRGGQNAMFGFSPVSGWGFSSY